MSDKQLLNIEIVVALAPLFLMWLLEVIRINVYFKEALNGNYSTFLHLVGGAIGLAGFAYLQRLSFTSKRGSWVVAILLLAPGWAAVLTLALGSQNLMVYLIAFWPVAVSVHLLLICKNQLTNRGSRTVSPRL